MVNLRIVRYLSNINLIHLLSINEVAYSFYCLKMWNFLRRLFSCCSRRKERKLRAIPVVEKTASSKANTSAGKFAASFAENTSLMSKVNFCLFRNVLDQFILEKIDLADNMFYGRACEHILNKILYPDTKEWDEWKKTEVFKCDFDNYFNEHYVRGKIFLTQLNNFLFQRHGETIVGHYSYPTDIEKVPIKSNLAPENVMSCLPDFYSSSYLVEIKYNVNVYPFNPSNKFHRQNLLQAFCYAGAMKKPVYLVYPRTGTIVSVTYNNSPYLSFP